ncbi:replication termination factor [Plasmodium gonderi]|uniref:Replication termination factor n=1 Tax=Plasmodium gonderi TaxID=77519 RepID=A0A1Y1JHU5_PLAGO|nr:replication termination factor [Plasmodium gonderi]GAW80332.1 replication termination factor [Plasmodium gonderi]
MGGDGGSLPQRVDLVRMKNKRLKENTGSLGYEKNTLVTVNQNKCSKKELKEHYFNHCAISQEVLQEPFFCCRLGYLYNKEHIFKLILFKKQNKKKRKKDMCYEHFSHIDSLKDLVLCRNKLNEDRKLVCLISNEIINSSSGAVCLFSCGCVFSKKVFNHAHVAKENVCTMCNRKFKSSDVIEIGIVDETLLEEKKKLIKRKKAKKDKEEKDQK